VHTIHEERIVHSDLKPANFLIVEGQLKLIDFGIAKAIKADTTSIARENQVGRRARLLHVQCSLLRLRNWCSTAMGCYMFCPSCSLVAGWDAELHVSRGYLQWHQGQ
jgi:serine/threonine protein kinase